jgi:hypothetical protein
VVSGVFDPIACEAVVENKTGKISYICIKSADMNTIIVQPKTKAEMQLVSEMLKKMRIASKVLSDEEREDMGLGILMKQANRSEKVSKSKVMAKLGRK